MFLLVTASSALAVFPFDVAVLVLDDAGTDVAVAFGSVRVFGDVSPGILDVPTLAVHLRAVLVGEFDQMMVKDLAEVQAGSDFTTTLPLCLDGITVHQPVAHIDVVNMLFVDVIATQPVEVVPVSHLVSHFRVTVLSRVVPYTVIVPVTTQQVDITDCTFTQTTDRFTIGSFVTALQANLNQKVLFLGNLVGLQHASNPRCVDGNRLFHKDVFAGLDCLFEMKGAEAGRCCQDDQFNVIALDQPFVGIVAQELVLVRDLDEVAVGGFQLFSSRVQSLFKNICDSDKIDVAKRVVHRIGGRPLAAASTANQADFDRFRSGNMRRTGNGKTRSGRNDSRRGQRCGSCLDKVTARLNRFFGVVSGHRSSLIMNAAMDQSNRITNPLKVINLLKSIRIQLCFCVVAFFTLASVQAQSLKRFFYSTTEMGVALNIVVYCENRDQAEIAMRQAVSRVQEVDRVFSDYRKASEASRLNANVDEHAVEISSEFLHLLLKSRELHAITEGAFDVTLGALTSKWRQARRDGKLPGKQELKDALAASGIKNLEITVPGDQQQVSRIRKPAGMQFDFGGIGKGYAADLALKSIVDLGHSSAFVDLGGDIAIGDPPPGKSGWRVMVAALPTATAKKRFVEVANCGIATSGDTEQFVEIEGIRYSHILDPLTGLGVRRRAHITVVALDAATADALASAYNVMDKENAIRNAISVAKSSILIQERTGDDLKETVMDTFPDLHELEK